MSITALTILEAASEFPVTLDDAKRQLRVTHSHEDKHIEDLIAAATSWAQNETRRIFMQTRVRLAFDRFPRRDESLYVDPAIDNLQWRTPRYLLARPQDNNARRRALYLPGGNVKQVEQIQYLDTNNVQQTLTGPTSQTPGTDYREDLTDHERAMVFPQREQGWPSVLSATPNAAHVDYAVGYGASQSDVPDNIRAAIRFYVHSLFAGGNDTMMKAAENSLGPSRIRVF